MKRIQWMTERFLGFEARHGVLCDILGVICIALIVMAFLAVGIADGKVSW